MASARAEDVIALAASSCMSALHCTSCGIRPAGLNGKFLSVSTLWLASCSSMYVINGREEGEDRVEEWTAGNRDIIPSPYIDRSTSLSCVCV